MSTPVARNGLFAYLDTLAIKTTTIDHPATFTVEQSSGVDLGLVGDHTKNLFLKDDEGSLILVIAKSSTKVDLKKLAKRLGAGRFSFAKPDLLQASLGVAPGSVTAFAIMNDQAGRVKVIMDKDLEAATSVNCHPLENTATTNIALDDLLRFIRSTGHELKFMTLTGP